MKIARFSLITLVGFLPGQAVADVAGDVKLVAQSAGQTPATPEFQAAWGRLARADSASLPLLLSGMNGIGPLETSALRMAIDAQVQHAAEAGAPLPLERLRSFFEDRQNSPRARQTAYELLIDQLPELRAELLASMEDDPAVPLRHEAVADLLAKADSLATDDPQRVASYRRAFDAAIDVEQKRACHEKLTELGEKLDLAASLGYVRAWRLVGPFDNTAGIGFDTAYPPEQSTDKASYAGKKGEVSWKAAVSEDDLGLLDLTQILGPEKGAVAYAEAVLQAPRAIEGEIRYTSRNGTKLWLNGELLCQHNVYHSGHSLDQYAAPCKLREGENRVLVKICQNEQPQPWAQSWELQLRVIDSTSEPAEVSAITDL